MGRFYPRRRVTPAPSRHPISMSPLVSQTSVPASALDDLLGQLASLIGGLPPDVYCGRFAAPHSGSIGEHVRHCLDHVSALLTADGEQTLSYDHRERGTGV